jgi:glycosyltransferase involved in cell wall biosynthesis
MDKISPSPAVTVIIPAFNAAVTIRETITSVLSQTFTDFELVIIDDGSTDTTAHVVASFTDQRIHYIYQPNQERAVARNRGISASQAKYLAFIDADDQWTPDKLAKQVALMESNPDLGLVYSDLLYTDPLTAKTLFLFSQKVKLYRGKVPIQRILIQNFIQSPTPLVRKEVFEEVGLFDPSLAVEDWDMWIRIVSRFPIDYIAEPLARYRVPENAVLWSRHPEIQHKAVLKMLDKVEQQLNLIPTLSKKMMRQARSQAHYLFGHALMHTQEYRHALDYYLKALDLNPCAPKIYFRLFQLIIQYCANAFRTTVGKEIHDRTQS